MLPDENPQGSVQIQVNGQPFYATGYYLDGTVNQDPILGIIVVNPTFDSVNEVKQANQDYDAEFDTFSAGLLTYSTKSGTNSLHGDAFEYIFLNTPGFQTSAAIPSLRIHRSAAMLALSLRRLTRTSSAVRLAAGSSRTSCSSSGMPSVDP